MLQKILEKIMGSDDKGDRQPLKHSFIRDEALAEKIHDTGFATAGFLEENRLNELKALYSSLHDFRNTKGGMFYTIYSRDIAYRRKVHDKIGEIMQPVYDSLFTGYRSILNSFIVKVSGPESEFSLHQDATSIDESKYSCLSVWMPLQDTGTGNGCMCVVPHSHKMFPHYRSISIPPPFDGIAAMVRKFLRPLELKAGEIFLFDNRLVHNSVVNQSGADRVVVMSGIFPKEAKLLSCYKDPGSDSVELIEQADEFLLTYENFNHDCTCRPEIGRSMKFVKWNPQSMSEQRFLALCRQYGVKEVNHPAVEDTRKEQAIIGEPVP